MNKKVLIGIGGVLLLCCFVCVAVLVFGGSVLNRSENAKDFNNKIITEQNEFQQDIIAFGNSFNDATLTKDEINEEREDLIEKGEKSMQVVKDLDAPKDGDEFQNLSIEIFEFYLDILDNEYVEAIDLKFSEDYSTESYLRILEIANEISAKESEFSERLEEVQTEFSEKYNFRLE